MSLKFVGIGFPKCGTTFLYNSIISHPKVVNNKKERHYFSKQFHSFSKNESINYLNKFNSNKVEGEFSPGILYYPLNIKYLSEAIPTNVKFITIVRNPIDRAHSHYKQMKNVRLNIVKPRNKSHFMKQSVYPEAIYSGLYGFAFNQLFKYVKKDRVLIVQYEKLCESFNKEMNNLFDFLNLKNIKLENKSHPPTKYNSFRKELKEFYEDDVYTFFNKYNNINKYSKLNIKYWEDFS